MPAPNVFIAVDDPDALIGGTSPYANFAAAKIELFRYASESAARADTNGSGGTLVTTFALVPSTTPASNPNISGPYRFGVYDDSQTVATWYRYRFVDADGTAFSPLSEPWEADNAAEWSLREILFEVGDLLGGSVVKGAAGANADASKIVCPQLWMSTRRDPRLYENWWVVALTGDAAGEECLIDSVDAATGTATLERPLGAAVDDGDEFLLSAYIQPSEMIRVINRARERMQVLATVDIALGDANRYPAPYGVRAVTDIIAAYGVIQYANSEREDLFEVDFDVEFDGLQGWLTFSEAEYHTRLVRLRMVRSFRDMEGPLTSMEDTTQAPIEWLRPVAAYAIAEFLADQDPMEVEYQRLKDRFADAAREASVRFGPQIVRPAKRGAGSRVRPGPAEVL